MSREGLAQRIWWETDVPIFLEKVVLPVLATVVTISLLVNPMSFDWPQRLSLFLAVIFLAYFVSHTLHIRNEAIRTGSVVLQNRAKQHVDKPVGNSPSSPSLGTPAGSQRPAPHKSGNATTSGDESPAVTGDGNTITYGQPSDSKNSKAEPPK
jgi:hypothetical protein